MGFNEGTGFALAVASAVFNGTFVAPFKTKRVSDLKLRPIIFQLYVACGVFASSWLALPFLQYNHIVADCPDAGTTLEFSLLGMLGGGLFIVSIVASFNAVELIGLALAQGIWGGVALLVSYLW